VATSISVYSSVGNFAPFFEVGIGAYLDGRQRIYWLIPLLLLTFMFSMLICTKALIDLIVFKVSGKECHAWAKTLHNGRGNLYLQQQSQAGCKLIPNPISSLYLFIILTFALCTFIIFLFLPLILELRRPKDPGPRKIVEVTTEKDE
jgi:hypothetical protein